jgi:hypothetical protein
MYNSHDHTITTQSNSLKVIQDYLTSVDLKLETNIIRAIS